MSTPGICMESSRGDEKKTKARKRSKKQRKRDCSDDEDIDDTTARVMDNGASQMAEHKSSTFLSRHSTKSKPNDTVAAIPTEPSSSAPLTSVPSLKMSISSEPLPKLTDVLKDQSSATTTKPTTLFAGLMPRRVVSKSISKPVKVSSGTVITTTSTVTPAQPVIPRAKDLLSPRPFPSSTPLLGQSTATAYPSSSDIISSTTTSAWSPPTSGPNAVPTNLSLRDRLAAARAQHPQSMHNKNRVLDLPKQTLWESAQRDRLLEAQILVPSAKNNKKRNKDNMFFEYPYGNYPTYYEKRITEQQHQQQHRPQLSENDATTTNQATETTMVSSSTGYSSRAKKAVADSLDIFMLEPIHYHTRSLILGNRKKKKRKITTEGISTLSDSLTTVPSHQGQQQQQQQQQRLNKKDFEVFKKKLDLRLEFLKPEWFRSKRVLDIGCNSGLLTCFLALYYEPSLIKGVDIDPSLVLKAQKRSRQIYSRCPVYDDDDNEAKQQDLKVGWEGTNGDQVDSKTGRQEELLLRIPRPYFPKSMYKIHGLLPLPAATANSSTTPTATTIGSSSSTSTLVESMASIPSCVKHPRFPNNIEFRVQDWAACSSSEKDRILLSSTHLDFDNNHHKDDHANNQEEDEEDVETWDVILAFSLTKWIHLHRGDEGLKSFFRKVYQSLTPGGLLLLEPQDFKTYRKRSKITEHMKKVYESIQFLPDQFEGFLIHEVGFRKECVQMLGVSDGGAKNFNRPIVLYQK